MALLHSNLGKLMRVCAQRYGEMAAGPDRREFTSQERHYYIKVGVATLLLGLTEKPSGKRRNVVWHIDSAVVLWLV